jgi:hypothetical protein
MNRWARLSLALKAALLGAAVALAAAAALAWWWVHRYDMPSVEARLSTLATAQGATPMACPTGDANLPPLRLLVLGQSNAANHGELAPTTLSNQVTVWFEGRCYTANDPLPGGTGRGGSLWSWLPSELRQQGIHRPVTLSVLAVGATSISDWTTPGAPLHKALQRTAVQLAETKQLPHLVLWQQGEADALTGLPSDAYLASLRALATQLAAAGIQAPILLGKSTLCRQAPSPAIRRAMDMATVDHRPQLPSGRLPLQRAWAATWRGVVGQRHCGGPPARPLRSGAMAGQKLVAIGEMIPRRVGSGATSSADTPAGTAVTTEMDARRPSEAAPARAAW